MKTWLCISAWGMLVAIAGCPAFAQQPAPKIPPVLFRTQALSHAVNGIFYDNDKGRQVPVMAATGNLSAAYVCPVDGRVAFYREEPPVPPETKPGKVPVAEVQLGKGGPWLLLMTPVKAGGINMARMDVLVVNDSWEVHPVHTVRVFNFMKRRARAAVKIGGETVELAVGESHIFPYAANDNESWMHVAALEEDGWVLRSSGPRATIAQTRSTVILSDAPPTPYDKDPKEVVVTNAIEPAPRPAGLAKAD